MKPQAKIDLCCAACQYIVVHNVFGLAVMCLELPDIANGGVTWAGLSAGNVANYTCTSGYELVGSPTRLCGDDGTYSGDEPFCRRKNNFNMHVHVSRIHIFM